MSNQNGEKKDQKNSEQIEDIIKSMKIKDIIQAISSGLIVETLSLIMKKSNEIKKHIVAFFEKFKFDNIIGSLKDIGNVGNIYTRFFSKSTNRDDRNV